MNQDQLQRAIAYPYPRPRGSFVFDLERGVTMLDVGPPAVAGLLDDRTAVLAVGSNAAPEQLARKFEGRAGLIPVIATDLADHDAVYAARVASYGAVPATVVPSRGTAISVHVTWLDQAQLSRMDETEGVGTGYEVIEIDASLLRSEVMPVGPALAYRARSGPLVLDGAMVALSAIPARGRHLPSMSEAELLALVGRRWGLPLEPFVERLVTDPGFRRAVCADLEAATDS